MAVKTDAIGKSWDPASFEVEAARITQYANAVGEQNPIHHDAKAAKAAGFRDLVAPPMFCVVAADDPLCLDTCLDTFQAWRRAGLPAELHVYEQGGHGFACWNPMP